MEAIANGCIMDQAFGDILDEMGHLVPTLHASIALEERSATKKNMKLYCPRVAKALRVWLEEQDRRAHAAM